MLRAIFITLAAIFAFFLVLSVIDSFPEGSSWDSPAKAGIESVTNNVRNLGFLIITLIFIGLERVEAVLERLKAMKTKQIP